MPAIFPRNGVSLAGEWPPGGGVTDAGQAKKRQETTPNVKNRKELADFIRPFGHATPMHHEIFVNTPVKKSNATNFRPDAGASGRIDGNDVSLVQSKQIIATVVS